MTTLERLLALQQTLYTSRNPTRRYLHCARRDWVLAQLQAVSQSGSMSTALEIGPGSGVYLPSLAEVASQVIAFDIEPGYLKAAKGLCDVGELKGKVDCVQGDLGRAPFKTESIDLLLCSEVIEHVADSTALLAAMSALLAPGGKLILTTPQPYSPVELLGKIAFLPVVVQLLRWIYREPIEPTGHINLLSRQQLVSQCTAAGLRIIERKLLGFYLPGIAEFAGAPGQRLLAAMERRLRGSALEGLLWTQCYVLEKDSGSGGSAARPSDLSV